MTSLNPTLITFLLYIVAMIVIGLMAYRATNNFSDYILGGRSLGSFVTALSAGASDMSGWLLMGLPGAIYLSGLSEMWIAIGLILGAWINWFLVAGRLRVHTEIQNNALTLPDYFSNRFNDHKKILRVVSAFVILIFFAIYCASGMVAGARLFESMFDMSYGTALWISAIATISYVFIGGFLAVSWTDTIQATLMIFALLLTPIVTILSLGDTAQIAHSLEMARPHATSLFENLSFIGIISLLAWGLGYFGQPHILVRFMAADSVKSIPKARRIGMTWMILCLGGAVAAGFFGIAFFQEHPELAGTVSKNPETVFMELTKILFNPWIAGIVLAGILAAVMSTLSCQLLVCSSTLTEDFYKAFIRKGASQKELVWVGRLMVLLISVLAIVLASNPDAKVLGLVSYAWAGFGAAFGPLIILSLFWKRMTLSGAIAGMITGALVVILWKNNFADTGLYEIIPGFICSFIVIIIVSLLGKAPSQDIVDRFDQADRIYKDSH
ncbi:sodium/proline symporter PutP [Acinetobacter gerneri]|uniref:Sodium/proline symporter n=2 Tax=Acinetobacter gerneri TaxID=202952 RepID=N8YEQ0_9GAMM|nr:sodium/proline symporter PutP [Acinetobacter gerneri]ENV35096.1 sodium/proline symporter [Acinetobacter gerneri DSM 14967 = CIP 107464 = MTCC 9824]MCH4244614.1 sodium/proline symporter PutP [Acinetobacter gerneri]MDQ9009749.1 sodium/proline symporter PutP [Acinetobacter gerneri]MDQ9013721.1 sodium/proline symporter PutP [Acinetobacter gerneri]MDQ9025135.1 sodium/proline symporter PutP [Acinetobacter gerneri]